MRETGDYREKRNLESEIAERRSGKEMLKRVGIVGGIALIAFLLGFVPMWLSARDVKNDCESARGTLRLSVLQNTLATAAINASRGEFEPARQQASDFFTAFRAELDSENSAFNEEQRDAVRPILQQRDEIITLLARSDAAAADRLADLYFAFMQTKNPIASKAQMFSKSENRRKTLNGIQEGELKSNE
ncbi:MAG TPA: hypothetical protein VF556_01185 [Pyrinomonadaceae bacterium]|jgi:hypothetical protein